MDELHIASIIIVGVALVSLIAMTLLLEKDAVVRPSSYFTVKGERKKHKFYYDKQADGDYTLYLVGLFSKTVVAGRGRLSSLKDVLTRAEDHVQIVNSANTRADLHYGDFLVKRDVRNTISVIDNNELIAVLAHDEGSAQYNGFKNEDSRDRLIKNIKNNFKN